MDKNKLTLSLGGKEITFETGKIARLANGAVVMRSGDTIILATACANKEPLPDIDFFPLRVDYQEKFSSAGKTLGGFIKREGKPTEKETLVSRLIDRPIRPLFPEGYFNDVQILVYVLSYDADHPPEALAITAASAALVISDIPLVKPVAGVRVGMIEDRFIVNPTSEEQTKSKLDLLIAGTEDAILMIEGYCDFLTEDQVLAAIEEGHQYIREICKNFGDWQNIVGKDKVIPKLQNPPAKLLGDLEALVGEKLRTAFTVAEKKKREEHIAAVDKEVAARFKGENSEYTSLEVKLAMKQVSSKLLRHQILKSRVRSDGRGPEDIRPISIETEILPRAHGSALFTRGETQAIAVCTLGGESMGQRYEDLNGEGLRKFYLQYSFPPFSVGEVGRGGAPGRREIGHGKLAERALAAVIPGHAENFPYTIRLESNITESNGSSSMASVCGGTLALMDAGVPIRRPVAGIAMGLILEENNFLILSDILGLEDALGDMDFKVTGDARGITAFQMDIKVEGITPAIMRVALTQARTGRIHILNKMLEACPKVKASLSRYAPRIETMSINPSKIGTVIGPGGKMIRSIIEETGVEIEINDEGIVSFSSTSAEQMKKAKDLVYNLTAELEVGKIYKGSVASIQPYGAFVKLPGTKDGLCHISEICHERVQKVEDVLKVGQEIEVKVMNINDQGQIKLSRKATLATQTV